MKQEKPITAPTKKTLFVFNYSAMNSPYRYRKNSTLRKIETPDGDYDEFYVVGKDFKWTYIVTHETDMGFGPYFMSLK